MSLLSSFHHYIVRRKDQDVLKIKKKLHPHPIVTHPSSLAEVSQQRKMGMGGGAPVRANNHWAGVFMVK